MDNEVRLFAGSANPALAESIARHPGAPLSPRAIERFPDGEVSVRLDESVRGCEVFIIQPTSPPVDEHVMELLISTGSTSGARRRGAAGGGRAPMTLMANRQLVRNVRAQRP